MTTIRIRDDDDPDETAGPTRSAVAAAMRIFMEWLMNTPEGQAALERARERETAAMAHEAA